MYQFNKNNNIAKWKLNEFDKLNNDFDEAIYTAIEDQKIKEGLDYTNILLDIAGKTIVTVREIICLTSNGFADGAMLLARTLYEHFIIVNFFEIHKNDSNFNHYVEDYYTDYYNSYNRYMKYTAKALGNTDLIKKINDSNEELKAKAHRKLGRDYWWSGKNSFAELAESVGDYLSNNEKLRRLYIRANVLYKQACFSVHSNCFGNMWRLQYRADNHVTDTRPSEDGHGFPLELTSISLIYITCTICKHLSIDYIYFHDGFNKLAAFYVEINNKGNRG